MNYDDILAHIGEFGRYQQLQYFMVCLVVLSSGVQIMMMFTFLLNVPDHRCAIPLYDNDSYSSNIPLVDVFIPRDDNNNNNMSQCNIYSNFSLSSPKISPTTECSSWVYDKSVFTCTVPTQMDLVCSRSIWVSHIAALLMAGQMLGCMVQGPVADMFGRKKTLLVCLFIHSVASILQAFSINKVMFEVCVFINGTAMAGAYVPAYVIGMEMIGPRWRYMTGVAANGAWSLGTLWAGLMAYLLRDWRDLQLAVSVPTVMFGLYYFFMPESARWLIQKGRFAEAEILIGRVAKENKTSLPDDFTTTIKHLSEHESTVPSESLLSLLKYPKTMIRALNVFFNWFVVSMAYYGLGQTIGSLNGDIFVNFALFGVFEIIAYVIVIVAMRWVGTKHIYTATLLMGALARLLMVIPTTQGEVSESTLLRVLAIMSRLGVSAAFATIWMFTSELFPTSMRASITGTCSFMSRTGALLSPYIATALPKSILGGNLPNVVFGVTGVAAGLMSVMLVETRNCQMPDTLREAEGMAIDRTRKASTSRSTYSEREYIPTTRQKHQDDTIEEARLLVSINSGTGDAPNTTGHWILKI